MGKLPCKHPKIIHSNSASYKKWNIFERAVKTFIKSMDNADRSGKSWEASLWTKYKKSKIRNH